MVLGWAAGVGGEARGVCVGGAVSTWVRSSVSGRQAAAQLQLTDMCTAVPWDRGHLDILTSLNLSLFIHVTAFLIVLLGMLNEKFIKMLALHKWQLLL